jgi:tetratricopeptide (TPR) repeat protein
VKRLDHFALLAGFLIAFSVLAWAHPSKAPTFTCRASPGCSTKTAEEALDHSTTGDRVQDFLREKAEAIAQQAARHREEQTYENLTTASRLFRESARIFATAHLYDKAADANIQAGEISAISSHYEYARRFFLDALRLARDPELRCRALSQVARTYASTGPYSTADSYSRQALNVCGPLSDRAKANAQEARGEVLLFSGGEHAKSISYFKRALQFLSEVDDDNERAQAHLGLAYALSADGQRSQALQSAGQALRIWTLTTNYSGVALAHTALGIFAVITGEFETAECNYAIARPLLREIGDKDNEASVLNGMGYVSGEFGDWQKSLEYYRRAEAAFASIHDLFGEYVAIQGIGRATAGMKKYSQLMPIYTAELSLARQSGNTVSVASALTDMAGAYEARTQKHITAAHSKLIAT